MSIHQKHFPNPKVDRKNRQRILQKRIKGIENKLPLKTGDIRLKRLADYKTELSSK